MKPLRPHKNVTFRRLVLDFYQFIRCQQPVVSHFGRPFERSRKYVEMDITYHCNLKCANCNRSCSQLPSTTEIPVDRVAAFVRESAESGAKWERIRILGGEPTLHGRFWDIIEILLDYKQHFNPDLRLVLCTNLFGPRVRSIVADLPAEIHIKTTLKKSRVHLFRPFNVAPIDTRYNRFSDYSSGCRIIEECGLGVTPSGYYMCAVAGGIDRIFGFNMGRKTLPLPDDSLIDQMRVFCPLCGHFGFAWPVKKIKMSPTWRQAYRKAETEIR